ncbi:MAG: transposase [Lentisphaeria bacterium]|jgi:transposase
MRVKFTQSFKIQAVEKALLRPNGVTIKEVADGLGVGHSTLGKWLIRSRSHTFESPSPRNIKAMSQEKRPEDWNTEDRMEMVIT